MSGLPDLSYAGWSDPQHVPCFPGTPRLGEDTTVAVYINHRMGLAILRLGGKNPGPLMSELHTTPEGLRTIVAACGEALART